MDVAGTDAREGVVHESGLFCSYVCLETRTTSLRRLPREVSLGLLAVRAAGGDEAHPAHPALREPEQLEDYMGGQMGQRQLREVMIPLVVCHCPQFMSGHDIAQSSKYTSYAVRAWSSRGPGDVLAVLDGQRHAAAQEVQAAEPEEDLRLPASERL